MNLPEGVQPVIIIGLDEEDYVHILSYVKEEITRDILLDALDILNEQDPDVAKIH